MESIIDKVVTAKSHGHKLIRCRTSQYWIKIQQSMIARSGLRAHARRRGVYYTRKRVASLFTEAILDLTRTCYSAGGWFVFEDQYVVQQPGLELSNISVPWKPEVRISFALDEH
jgi:hypothetical protein